MKTSSIIFIFLIGFVAILMLGSEIKSKQERERNVKNEISNGDKLRIRESYQKLPMYSILSIKNCKGLTLIQSDSTYLKITSPTDSILPEFTTRINGDTLMIQDVRLPAKSIHLFKMYIKPELKEIDLKNSIDITLKGKGNDSNPLNLNLDSSKLVIISDINQEFSIATLDIKSINNSSVIGRSFEVNSLNLDLTHSRAEFSSVIDKLNGNLQMQSDIILRAPREIALKRDKSSVIRINE